MFDVRVIGTIAKNSRTITFRYYFTDFATVGTTGTAAHRSPRRRHSWRWWCRP
ncbi:hypothetical protein [Streptomyces sp. NPDC005009]